MRRVASNKCIRNLSLDTSLPPSLQAPSFLPLSPLPLPQSDVFSPSPPLSLSLSLALSLSLSLSLSVPPSLSWCTCAVRSLATARFGADLRGPFSFPLPSLSLLPPLPPSTHTHTRSLCTVVGSQALKSVDMPLSKPSNPFITFFLNRRYHH